jgi:hypothetical protein
MPTQGQLDGQEAIDELKASVVDLLVAIGMAEGNGAIDVAPARALASDEAAGGSAATGGVEAGVGVEAGWTAHQVLAHIVWWHERYLSVLSALVDGRARPALAGKLDDINVTAVDAYGERSIDDLSDTLRTKEHAIESLVGVLYELPRSERDALVIVTRDEGKPGDLDGFVKRVTSHLHGHAQDIRGTTA